MHSTTLFCSECLGTSEKNGQGEHENLISCSECGSSVHPSCLKRAGTSSLKEEEDWLCSECKSCNICGERAEIVSLIDCVLYFPVLSYPCILKWLSFADWQDPLLICNVCEQGFHAHCVDPPVEKRPKIWSCSNCAARRKSKLGTKSADVSLKKGRKRVDSSSSEEGNILFSVRNYKELILNHREFFYFSCWTWRNWGNREDSTTTRCHSSGCGII